MKNIRTFGKIIFTAILFFIPAFLSARDAVYTCPEYKLFLSFNDTALSGDAVFIRMTFTDLANKANKSSSEKSVTATASLYLETKKLLSSDFYMIEGNDDYTRQTFLTGIPLSTWWTSGNYRINVRYSYQGQKLMEFTLPFNVTDKEFESETIKLDQRNTEIKTDTSTKRVTQIDRLNSILETKDVNGVYETSGFLPPTQATRITSNYGDRRVYEYTNGKSSTSLHYGKDYGIPTGSTVSACARGKVVLAESRVSTGWSVVIEHLPGLYSLYYHMDSLSVSEGDIVEKGDLLGLSGATGLATGPHLHWEMRLNTWAVNPDFFLGNFTFAK